LPVKQVAEHLELDWKTVKQIDKAFLEEEYAATDYQSLKILAVDEIAIRKGHHDMTVVLDYLSGRVVWMGEHRTKETLQGFFQGMSAEQKAGLEAIAMDMWEPFIAAVKEEVPHVSIVFDLFHAVAAFNKAIDAVRNDEYRKASKADREVIKGSKYLLLKNRRNIRKKKHREHLKRLLSLNEVLSTVMILKDELKMLWRYRYRASAQKALDRWCALARGVGHPLLDRFARRLETFAFGIVNHCDYPIHTSKLEGVNNKIKVIKRKAYGFHDLDYFRLKGSSQNPWHSCGRV
jgi:transposase